MPLVSVVPIVSQVPMMSVVSWCSGALGVCVSLVPVVP